MRVLLLHNPQAGTGDVSEERLRRAFTEAGFEVLYRPKHKGGLSDEDMDGVPLLVVAGGDGTVAAAVLAYRRKVPLFGVIPLGTANNIASALGATGTPEALVDGFRHGREQPFDVGFAQRGRDRWEFLEGVGLGAISSAMAEADRLHGPVTGELIRSRCMVAEAIARAPTHRWHIRLDGAPLPDELLLVEVLNAPRFGPGLEITVRVEPDDGQFDVAFLRPERRAEVLAAMGDGAACGPLPLEVMRGREVEITLTDAAARVDDAFQENIVPGEVLRLGFAPPQAVFLMPFMEGGEAT